MNLVVMTFVLEHERTLSVLLVTRGGSRHDICVGASTWEDKSAGGGLEGTVLMRLVAVSQSNCLSVC